MGKGFDNGLRSGAANRNQPGMPRSAPMRRQVLDDQDLGDSGELEYENLKPQSDEAGKMKYEKRLEANVTKHLSMMPDPYHIAQHISSALRKGNFDEALLMTRMASRKAKVEVSWNHLIDYQLKNKRLHAAIKLYNEVRISVFAVPA
jgi:pentatricopeptide repeat protein